MLKKQQRAKSQGKDWYRGKLLNVLDKKGHAHGLHRDACSWLPKDATTS